MGQRSRKRKPFRKVTSAEDQQERAELAKYRASLRRIQETERLAKQMRRAIARVKSDTFDLAVRIINAQGFEAKPIARPAAVNE